MLLAIAGLAGSTWLGQEWAVSRYQDWRREGERIECVDRTLPARTAHFLPLRLNPRAAPVGSTATMRVRMELLGAPDGASWALAQGQWAGVLVGIGNEAIDYRLSSLVQQAPGVEGGTLIACSGSGDARVVDFGHALVDEQFVWSLPTKLDWDQLPRWDGPSVPGAPKATPSPTAWSSPATLTLEIEIKRGETNCDLIARSSIAGAEAVGSVARRLPFEALDGGIALCCSLVGAPAGIAYTVEVTRFSSPEWRDVDCNRASGPVLGCLYTVDRTGAGMDLRLSAQFPPLDPATITDLALWLGTPTPAGTAANDGEHILWSHADDATIDVPSCTALFEARLSIPAPTRYEVRCNWKQGEGAPVPSTYGGAIRAEPQSGQSAVLGALSCVKNMTRGGRWDHDGVWFPHADLVARVAAHNPDLLYFAGDQIYEGDISGADIREARLDYLTKWHRFLWAYGSLMRDRPTICTPDDHDVFHGNLWGAGGRKAAAHDGLSAQDAGGYKLPAEIVNAVHRSQTGHHPPTRITPTIEQGITTWTTRLVWGPFDCAIISDRMFKESASAAVPAAKVRNGFATAGATVELGAGIDATSALCAPSVIAPLLGREQEEFLSRWADDPIAASPVRLVLSQSPFAGVQTLPTGKDDGILPTLEVLPQGGFYPDDSPVADTDSNGWPVAARDRAVALIKRARAVHVAGDQHLASVVRYGYAEGDPIAFTVPAMANSFPRHWTPSHGIAPDARRFTGEFEDAFGNPITVLAVANPSQTDRTPGALAQLSPGFALIRYEPANRELILEAWPRVAPPVESSEGDSPFAGWPIRVPLAPPLNR